MDDIIPTPKRAVEAVELFLVAVRDGDATGEDGLVRLSRATEVFEFAFESFENGEDLEELQEEAERDAEL